MNRDEAMNELITEIGFVLRGLVEAGYSDEYCRVIWSVNTDFHTHFPQGTYFALFVNNGALCFFPSDCKADIAKKIAHFQNGIQYRVVPRAVAEMIGREYEYYQYCEAIAETDQKAAQFALKQQEIIDFIFSSK